MARIHALPSLEIIRGLKGILDFYVWRGLPCVRAWPQYRPARQTAASLAAALFFGAVVKSYSLLGDVPLEAYRLDAKDQPRSARDIFVSGIYGNLHEADVSDFLTLLTECRDFLSALTAILNALDSIDTDELVVNVDESALPAGAGTAANQATAIAALQKLDDLQDALESKALDRFLVRGMDQLHSYLEPMAHITSGPISGAGGFIDSGTPADGLVWHITHIATRDDTSPITACLLQPRVLAGATISHHEIRAIPANTYIPFACNIWLEHDDTMRAFFTGALAGDTVRILLTGQAFTKET